jgi:hexulose-6-phosphate isomerase
MSADAKLPSKKRALKKGFTLGSFPDARKFSLIEQFQMLKGAGFDGVEVGARSGRKEVLDARDKTGLPVAGISCGPFTRPFASASGSERQSALEGLLETLRNGKEWGVKSVLVVAGGVNEKISYAENYQRTREQIRKAVPLAEELGIGLAIENVWNNFLLSPLEAARYIDELQSPIVGWHFDVGNVMSIGWAEHWIQVLGKRIQKIHIKEFSREKMNNQGLRKGFSVEYLEGDNDWPSVMRALDEIGYEGWCIIEDACGSCKAGLSPENYLRKISARLDTILAS